MKDHSIAPNDQEVILEEGDYIVSSTDLSGRITEVNVAFAKYCGYSEPELLASQHNIVRHPDMPRTVFWLMWGALNEGEEFFGYVKNKRKDGGFYWVFAHVFPILDEHGERVGYRSNRRKPKHSALQEIGALYQQILAAEKAAGPRMAIEAGCAVLGKELARRQQSYDDLVATL